MGCMAALLMTNASVLLVVYQNRTVMYKSTVVQPACFQMSM